MNALIAILFSAVVVSAMPSGWGPPPPPPVPVIDLELSGAVAAAGDGSAQGSQVVSEVASGNAALISLNGVAAAVDQNGDVLQVASADLSGPEPVTTTLQGVGVSNAAGATDSLQVIAVADNQIVVNNDANTSAEGEGAIAAVAESLNSVIAKKH